MKKNEAHKLSEVLWAANAIKGLVEKIKVLEKDRMTGTHSNAGLQNSWLLKDLYVELHYCRKLVNKKENRRLLKRLGLR